MTNANTLSLGDKIDINLFNYIYSLSVAKEVASKGNSGGILIIGMIVVIVGIIGYIITKNK